MYSIGINKKDTITPIVLCLEVPMVMIYDHWYDKYVLMTYDYESAFKSLVCV